MGAKKMLNVFLLIMVVYVIFGGAAVQMWAGVLRQQCYDRAQVINEVPTYPSTIIPIAISQIRLACQIRFRHSTASLPTLSPPTFM
jgi:hypothetical protein